MAIEDYMRRTEQCTDSIVARIKEQQETLEADYQSRRASYFSNDEGSRYCRVDVLLDFVDQMDLPVQGAQKMSVTNEIMKHLYPELKVEYEAMKWGRALHKESQRLGRIAQAAYEGARK